MAKKIVIIEDDEKNRLLLKDLLAYHGYEVVEADNGETGFCLIKEQRPDLIFLDIQIPLMNGFEVIQKIKSDAELKKIRIVVVTSFAMKGDREKMLEMGADEYVSKPINTRQISEIARKLLDGK